MSRLLALCATLATALPAPLHAQAGDYPNWQFNIGVGDTGLAFGNSRVHDGIRINWKDYRLDRIRGVNITLWSPDERVGGEIQGLALGLVYPQAGRIKGVG